MNDPIFLSDGEVDDIRLSDADLVEPTDEVPVNPWVERGLWLLMVVGTPAVLWGAWEMWRWFVRALLS